MNPFDVSWVAQRYRTARPNVHPRILAPLRSLLHGELPGRALDVGCGTGLSSVALTGYATRVIGVDVSREMLQAGARHPAVRCVVSRAESLPFRPASFDLATLGCVFHWCQPEPLFAELGRVLSSGAFLLIYDNHFFGEMREVSTAQEWFSSVYQARYPAPVRNAPFWPDQAPSTFQAERSDFVDEWVSFTREELIRYLTTQSNIVHAVESGRTTLAAVEDFLHHALAPLYRAAGAPRADFRFGGFVHCLRRVGFAESDI